MMLPKVRQALYTVGVLVFSALTILSTVHVIDTNTASSVSAALTAILGAFGVTVSGVAGYNVTKQTKSGAFDTTSPADKVISGVNEVLAAQKQATNDVQRVKDAVTQVVGQTPILGPVAKDVLDQILN